MAGISSKAAGKLENKFKYNSIEHNSDFDLNMYDAFYRNLDPQIGRFWQIDPEAEMLEEYSPYSSMDNNPISNVDPFGNFSSKFGAWLHKVFNGGGSVGENKYGEFYVQKVTTTEEGSATVSLTYGKGRDMYSNARQALARDAEIEANIQMNGENSMYEMYDSPQESGMGAIITGFGLWLPNALIRTSSNPSRTGNAVNAGKGGLTFNKGVLENFTKHAFAGGRHADLGLSVETMASKGLKLVEKNMSLLKAGDNTLIGNINGIEKSFKAFVQDGKIISVNMYSGISNRATQGTVINFGNVTW